MADEAKKLTAMQVFGMIKIGVGPIVAAAEAQIKAGNVLPIPKSTLEGRKDKGLKEFIEKYKIPVTDTPVRGGGGPRAGIKETALEIAKGNENDPLVKAALQYQQLGKTLNDLLKPHKRSLSFGYIRGVEKEEAPAPSTAAPVGAPAPAKQ